MFRTVEDFLATWARESTVTARVMDALTDDSLAQSVAAGHRSLGQLAWHIAVSHRSMLSRTGLDFGGPTKALPVPPFAAEIRAHYLASAANLARAVETQWTDRTLQQEDDIYGLRWSRGRTLLVLVSHEIHHRGQMSVLMRQAGLSLPDIYGPSKQDA